MVVRERMVSVISCSHTVAIPFTVQDLEDYRPFLNFSNRERIGIYEPGWLRLVGVSFHQLETLFHTPLVQLTFQLHLSMPPLPDSQRIDFASIPYLCPMLLSSDLHPRTLPRRSRYLSACSFSRN